MSRRKRIVACMALDNHAKVGYPLEAVIESVGFADEWLFAASDEDNAKALLPYGPTTITGAHIRAAGDLPFAVNAALDSVFAESDADVAVFVPADAMSTPEVDAFIREHAQSMDSSCVHWLCARDCHLFYHFQRGWGFPIIGRQAPRFTKAGLGASGSRLENAPECLHIGFLGSSYAWRHARNNARLWGSPEHAAEVEGHDFEAFLRWYLPFIKSHCTPRTELTPIAEMGPHFEGVIDRLGLRHDQAFIYDFARREGLV